MTEYADGINPGLELGAREIVITDDWIEKYRRSIDDDNPWYAGESPFGGPIAPAAVFNYEMEMFKGWHPPGIGNVLNTGQSWEFRRPMRPGQRVTLKGRVVERYLKRGREHVAMEATAYDEEGNLLCRTVTVHSWTPASEAS
ncbi:MAG: MaoC family dehydratase N-terminal domain-containing protein [Chloroflexi bacterium]|nr:MaoC family dehydratase N-terminal domain-containing protein [Chloroflexota bacterium]